MAILTEIDTEDKLILWIKRKLGYPTIQLEFDDDVLKDNINDAVKYFNRYSADSRYKSALTVALSAGIDEYVLPEETVSAIDFNTTISIGAGITTLFSMENILYNEGILQFDKMGVGGIISWELANQYMEMFRDKLIPKIFVTFNKYNKTMKITPLPKEDLVGIVEVYTLWDQTSPTVIYDEIWIKNYALALSMIVLGNIWSKYNGMPLPGGGTLNADNMINQGIATRNELENSIIVEYEEPLGFWTG